MKRNTLTTAVLAGLTGVAGMASVSHAVNLNPDGLGQVLLYPYYTARGHETGTSNFNGNDTLISIVNTTDNAKSVKVRFLEGLNSREVLDFNLYLSAFDVWVAAVTTDVERDSSGTPTDPLTVADGARIIVPDSSCTVPYFFGADVLADDETEDDRAGDQEFLDFGYAFASDDGGPQGIDRTESGYIEVIEMGTLVDLTNNSATAATHVITTIDGVEYPRPANCQQLVNAWSTIGGVPGYWLGDNDIDHNPPSGGLFGGASIINVSEGTMFSYNAEAIDGFAQQGDILHTNPGSLLPNLNNGQTVSNVFFNGLVDTRTWQTSAEAVSANFMYETLMNEYVVGGNRKSEWVITFPTKSFYVDTPNAIGPLPVAPFTNAWSGLNTACEEFAIGRWDREEDPTETPDVPPIVSPPPPPGTDPDPFRLCYETNVVVFGDAGAESEILLDDRFTTLPVEEAGFTEGWVRYSFSNESRPTTGASDPGGNQVQYLGLPVIGFWVNTFSNGDLGNGVAANYGGTFRHRGSRNLQTFVPAPTP